MKTIHLSAIVAAILFVPVVSFAQQADAPLSRAQVRAELAALESVGYTPSVGADPHYPNDIEAAEAKLNAKGTVKSSDTGTTSVGGVMTMSESGHRQRRAETSPGRASQRDASMSCVGPAGFCVLYFGS